MTPRALHELARLGVEATGHRIDGVRVLYGGHELSVPWPDHPQLPACALAVRRQLLDERLRRHAADAGATVLMGHEALTPIAERGFIRGARVAVTGADAQIDIRSRFVVVADGANSRFGRALGTTRERRWPYALLARTYHASPHHDSNWLESLLGPPDPDGHPIAGYGWVTPIGDGTVNIGVGLLSTYRAAKGVNVLSLLDAVTERMAERWELEPEQLKAPVRSRLPLGGSVGPQMGPTFLVVGDAAGVANPFNGDGVDAALMSARLAADVLDDALGAGGSAALQRYPRLVADEVGEYHQVGRLAARFLGQPAVLRPMLRLASRRDRVMGAALRIATNELRRDHGGAERAYATARLLARFAPSW